MATRENALANIETTLEAAGGSGYNYSIDEAYRIDGPFFVYLEELDESVETVAFIEEGEASWAPYTHDGVWLVTLEVFIGVARRYNPSSSNPLEVSTTKSAIRSKLVDDIALALLADNTRGGYAKRGFVLTGDGPQNLDDVEDGEDGPVWFHAPWVAHELRFEMAMEIDESSP